MTDKELKDILQSSTFSSKDERYNDAAFTQRVMSQCLEHTNKEVRTVVWTIRIVAAVVAIIVLFLLTPSTLTSIQSAIFNIQYSIESMVAMSMSTFSFSSGSYLFALTSCLIIALLLSRRLD